MLDPYTWPTPLQMRRELRPLEVETITISAFALSRSLMQFAALKIVCISCRDFINSECFDDNGYRYKWTRCSIIASNNKDYVHINQQGW